VRGNTGGGIERCGFSEAGSFVLERFAGSSLPLWAWWVGILLPRPDNLRLHDLIAVKVLSSVV
jgi:hypothetical protein